MKIYTKGGDAGETGLYGGERVPKDDRRIAAYGTLDELNAVIGIALTHGDTPPIPRALLTRAQSELFQLGAELATPGGKRTGAALLAAAAVTALETEIDAMERELAPLRSFILPGGTALAAHLHLARTVCRRAEREIVALHRTEALRPEVLHYVNRLSDALFVAARLANAHAGREDVPWLAPKATALTPTSGGDS